MNDMNTPDANLLHEALTDRIAELEKLEDKREERYKGDGSDPAVWKKVEPSIKRDVVEYCQSNIEEVDNVDDLRRVLAEWRRMNSQEWEFMTNKSPTENERNSIKRAELRDWIEELVDLIPDSEFKTCNACGSKKMPESDRRLKIGYRWECPECPI